MALLGVPFGAALLVLGLLIVLRQYGRHLAEGHQEAYRNLVLGTGLFGLVTVLYLARETDATAAVPFLSQPPFLELSAAILAITGLVLVAGGASIWMPRKGPVAAGGTRLCATAGIGRASADAISGQLMNSLLIGAPLTDAFAAMSRSLREMLGTELCSLSVTYSDRDVRRYTIGDNGTLLAEKSLRVEAARWGRTVDGPEVWRPAVVTDFEKYLEPSLSELLRRQQFSAALIAPIAGTCARGVLVLASRRSDGFGAAGLAVVEDLHRPLAMALSVERVREGMGRAAKQLEGIGLLLRESADQAAGIDGLFRQSAALLREFTGAVAVRIALFEDDGMFLRSRALSCAQPVENAVPATGYLIRSLMPLHQQVQKTGEVSLVHGGDAKGSISMAEAQQIYVSDLSAALLCPIRAGSEVLGIITLADRREGEGLQFTDDDRVFATTVAAILAQAIRLHETPWGALTVRDRADSEEQGRRSELRGRIRSSLTGILGSVEMLRTHPAGTETERFVQIIDRSARRIEGLFIDEESAR